MAIRDLLAAGRRHLVRYPRVWLALNLACGGLLVLGAVARIVARRGHWVLWSVLCLCLAMECMIDANHERRLLRHRLTVGKVNDQTNEPGRVADGVGEVGDGQE